MTTTYILGAGFSHAVAGLPLLNALGAKVEEELTRTLEGGLSFSLDRFRGNIESWMSFAAFDQPWLRPEENLRNRSDAQRATQQIAHEIYRSEICYRNEYSDFEAPENGLIARLARHWMADRSAIISFNYDTIVESALLAAGFDRRLADLYVLPTVGETGEQTFGRNFNTFYDYDAFQLSLMKLHGSVNWKYSGPLGSPSDPVHLIWTPPGWGAAHDAISARPLQKPHLVDLIVPPASVKDAYYSNVALAHQWRLARRAIGLHDEIVVIGFSLPTTDIAVRNLIATSWPGPDYGAKFTVVDPSITPAEHLRSILPDSARINTEFCGRPDALEAYVTSLDEAQPKE